MHKIAVLLLLLLIPHPVLGETVFEGIIKPAREVELALPIDGPVSTVYVKEGDAVKKGEKILKLDDVLQKLEVDRKTAILKDHAELDASRKGLAIILAQLDSSKTLYRETASVSQDEVQKLDLQYQAMLGRVQELEAKKTEQRIECEIARELLVRHTLLSPVDGIVTKIDLEPGEWARAGETVATIVSKKICYVEFNIVEHDAHALKNGDKASVWVGGENGMTASGIVTYIAPVADSASALVRVKVEFENASGKIIPGLLAKIVFE